MHAQEDVHQPLPHLRADVVTFSRTILSNASLYKALFWTLGFHIRRFLQQGETDEMGQ